MVSGLLSICSVDLPVYLRDTLTYRTHTLTLLPFCSWKREQGVLGAAAFSAMSAPEERRVMSSPSREGSRSPDFSNSIPSPLSFLLTPNDSPLSSISSQGAQGYIPSSPGVTLASSPPHSFTFLSPDQADLSPESLSSTPTPGRWSSESTCPEIIYHMFVLSSRSPSPSDLRDSPVSPSYSPTIPRFPREPAHPPQETPNNSQTSGFCSPIYIAVSPRHPPVFPYSSSFTVGHTQGLTATVHHCPFTPTCTGEGRGQHEPGSRLLLHVSGHSHTTSCQRDPPASRPHPHPCPSTCYCHTLALRRDASNGRLRCPGHCHPSPVDREPPACRRPCCWRPRQRDPPACLRPCGQHCRRR